VRQPREESAGPLAPQPLPEGAESRLERLFGEVGNAGAWVVRAGAHRPLHGPDGRGTGGQFWLLAAGDVTLPGVAHDDPWCLFVAPDDPPPVPVAGASGAAMLVLQFRPLPGVS